MKNSILIMAFLGLLVSCGPSEEKEGKMRNLVTEWKNTSDKLISLSEKIGDQTFLLESKEEGSGVIEIDINGEQSNCEDEYSAMNEEISAFIEEWKVNSFQVDELTGKMSTGKWTAEDDESLESLDQEAKEADLTIEQWLVDLEELRKKCDINPENTNS
ncbi:hypothetical protein [Algoriphagus sp. NG3]|uniref:hypothetical protein n=1 Tax=Algoriphagus sp. NG3 TaxID=3097546 RepID=UPI002A7F8E5F|nr:hypothetical protein [Algoriphagus sp. NG3]WPR74652.1 hypothetical protein SLW71_18475 [Algoriphagus sp. NG3]